MNSDEKHENEHRDEAMQSENNENPYYIHPEIEESLHLSSRQCPFLFHWMCTSSSNSDTLDDENSKLNRKF